MMWGNSDWSYQGIGKSLRLMTINFLRKCLRVFPLLLFLGGLWFFLPTGWAGDPQGYRAFRNGLIGDRTRPTYHLVSPEGKASPMDPNCAIYWKGRYHLFYIFQGIYSHVSSHDLVHWRWHPDLRLGSGIMNSGGCCLNKDGIPTLIYMSDRLKRNAISMAADDDLEKWSEPTVVEPEVGANQDGSKISHWDPEIWREGNIHYALFGNHPFQIGKEATVMKSTDLKTWEYIGPFLSKEMPEVSRTTEIKTNEDISCPNFFKLGEKWMLLCISHIRGCRYYLGEWNGEQFTPEFHARMNWSLSDGMKEGGHGGEFFAPETLLTPDGRRVMWAWCFASSRSGGNGLWDGILSLPRELSLSADGILRIKPVKELEQLRYLPVTEPAFAVESAVPYRLKCLAGDTIEIIATIKRGIATGYGMRLLANKENGAGIDLVVEPESKTIRLGSSVAPLELKPGEDIVLRVFIDRRTVEIFANDRQSIVKQHTYEPDETGVSFFSEGGRMEVKEVRGWKMSPTNPW